jgi:hypothetical protein
MTYDLITSEHTNVLPVLLGLQLWILFEDGAQGTLHKQKDRLTL